MSDPILDLIRPVIRELSAYHVADASGMVKLDAMENPYRLSDEIRAELGSQLSAASINRYPDPSARELTEKLRTAMAVPEDMGMILGNGSDELIQILAMAVAGEERSILSFDPGFVMYRMIATFAGLEYVGIPLDEDFGIDLDATLSAIDQHRPAIIFIAYPNNPTANCFDRASIDAIIRASAGLVVVDEAYHPFAQDSYMPSLHEFDNLLVMRTVSKMGLAGLRLGMLCGRADVIRELDKIRLPYNINVLTQIAATVVLSNAELLDEQAAAIRDQRSRMLSSMRNLDGIEVFDSDANFILFRVKTGSAGEVFDAIHASGVLIKNMRANDGALANCLRVTVGTPEENECFLEALRSALS